MGFADDFLAEDTPHFNAAFGEAIVYTPRGSRTPITIYGVIDRNQPVVIEGANMARRPKFTIVVANDATTGIMASDPAMIGGSLSFPHKIGRTAETVIIPSPNPVQQDAGAITIEI